jgi:hypothetical protein
MIKMKVNKIVMATSNVVSWQKIITMAIYCLDRIIHKHSRIFGFITLFKKILTNILEIGQDHFQIFPKLQCMLSL